MVSKRKEMQAEEEKDVEEAEKKLKGIKDQEREDDDDEDEEGDAEKKDDLEEEDDDDDDGDFELEGGDMVLYDSALDDLDELIFAKETLEGLKTGRAEYFQHLFGGLDAA